MKIASTITEVIGRTPLVSLGRVCAHLGLDAEIVAKIEALNPAGSVKDRAALYMLDDAERRGIIKRGGDTAPTVIEPTSGNTGIGLCAIGASRGYNVVIVMPDSMSVERRLIMEAYGARVVLTDGALGMKGAIAKAEEIQRDTPGSFIVGQFSNPSNALAHYETTGPEIWEDTDGVIDAFVAGVGTGGTLTGVGRYLKEKNNGIEVVAVEPKSSPLLSEGRSGSHGLQGIGANFVPEVLDRSVIDRIETVTEEEAFEMMALVARLEGILVGISSGAALAAAVRVARERKNGRIAVLFPDSGERYLSVKR